MDSCVIFTHDSELSPIEYDTCLCNALWPMLYGTVDSHRHCYCELQSRFFDFNTQRMWLHAVPAKKLLHYLRESIYAQRISPSRYRLFTVVCVFMQNMDLHYAMQCLKKKIKIGKTGRPTRPTVKNFAEDNFELPLWENNSHLELLKCLRNVSHPSEGYCALPGAYLLYCNSPW